MFVVTALAVHADAGMHRPCTKIPCTGVLVATTGCQSANCTTCSSQVRMFAQQACLLSKSKLARASFIFSHLSHLLSYSQVDCTLQGLMTQVGCFHNTDLSYT